jgi:terminase small subunit-like protein
MVEFSGPIKGAEPKQGRRHNGGPPLDDNIARKRGRPSTYTPELDARIFHELCEGKSLRSICREPSLPSVGAVLGWVTTKPEFRRRYDIARQCGRETIAEEVLEIADGLFNSPEAIKEARRQIDALKWHYGRMTPKRRGPRPVTALENRP